MSLIHGSSLFELKRFGESGKGFISGRASDITPDRDGDVIVPTGLKFRLPLPLKLEHRDVVGEVTAAAVTDTGIDIQAQLADPDQAESVTLKERLRLAWDSVRLGLARGFSVGLLPLKSEPIGHGSGRKFTAAELVEISIVAIPANSKASIAIVKSLAREQRRPGVVWATPVGDSVVQLHHLARRRDD